MLVMRKHGKFRLMPTGANRHNVRFAAQKPAEIAEERNFLIAPTMCMKTKDKSWQGSIAPTIFMKMNKLFDSEAFSHDVDERQYSYPMN